MSQLSEAEANRLRSGAVAAVELARLLTRLADGEVGRADAAVALGDVRVSLSMMIDGVDGLVEDLTKGGSE